MTIHELKTHPLHFEAIKKGVKKFELRVNDRNYKIHDQLLLKEFTPKDYWDPEEPKEDTFSGEILHRKISYILNRHEGLAPGFVILGLEKL